MFFHFFEFCGCKRSWFEQNGIGHSYFSHIMKRRGLEQQVDFLWLDSIFKTLVMHEMLSHSSNVLLCTKYVVASFWIPCFCQGRPPYYCAISCRCKLTFTIQNTKLLAAKTC